jgi:hypothetical protein
MIIRIQGVFASGEPAYRQTGPPGRKGVEDSSEMKLQNYRRETERMLKHL